MNAQARWLHLLSSYGMLLVLLLLCAAFSAATIKRQQPAGAAAASQVAGEIASRFGQDARVAILASSSDEDRAFANALAAELARLRVNVVEEVRGQPSDARAAFARLNSSGRQIDALACTRTTAGWLVVAGRAADFPNLARAEVVSARDYLWPDFLKRDNLRNIANQIAVIAIVAIGMTMVIIAGGIDLSVGSLIALSAIVSTLLIREAGGARDASAASMTLCCLAGIALCGLVGMLSGMIIRWFDVPPFIVTLAMMLVASGTALRLTAGESVYELPGSFVWLGRGTMLGVPNAVLLMLLLYAAAHVLMSRMTLGRYIYAVGGNAEAARLAGVPVGAVLLFAYAMSGALAGLGGVIMASQLKSGSPNYGVGYELSVIAAVVVGGASLSGGEGRMFGTLIGAFIIAVIQNGMNLMNINPFTQKITLGLVILAAVLLDKQKQRLWASASGK